MWSIFFQLEKQEHSFYTLCDFYYLYIYIFYKSRNKNNLKNLAYTLHSSSTSLCSFRTKQHRVEHNYGLSPIPCLWNLLQSDFCYYYSTQTARQYNQQILSYSVTESDDRCPDLSSVFSTVDHSLFPLDKPSQRFRAAPSPCLPSTSLTVLLVSTARSSS